jgi:hypothetical protein
MLVRLRLKRITRTKEKVLNRMMESLKGFSPREIRE